jgi:hypothetical protein
MKWLFACHKRPAPRTFEDNAEALDRFQLKHNVAEARGSKFAFQVLHREQSHYECRTDSAVEVEIAVNFQSLVGPAVDQHVLAGKFDNRILE